MIAIAKYKPNKPSPVFSSHWEWLIYWSIKAGVGLHDKYARIGDSEETQGDSASTIPPEASPTGLRIVADCWFSLACACDAALLLAAWHTLGPVSALNTGSFKLLPIKP